MTLKDYIKSYRNAHDISQRQFAIKCNLSNGYISMLESGVNPKTKQPIIPTLMVLKKLAEGMSISVDSLLANVDDMPVTLSEDDGNNSRPSSPMRELPSNVVPLPQMRKVPLVSQIACGTPILTEQNITDYIDLPSHIQADYALTCKGESMINLGIEDGDIVYIRQQKEVENGQVAAVMVGDGEATLKRFYFENGIVQLVAENSAIAPKVFVGEAINQVHVIGRAIAYTHIIE